MVVRCRKIECRQARTYGGEVQPLDIQLIGEELAIKWDDGTENFIRLEALRRHCPCAGCKGEVDILGNLYRNPEQALAAEAFRLRRITRVGGYAVQLVWGDGHSAGIYSYEYLKRVGESSGA